MTHTTTYEFALALLVALPIVLAAIVCVVVAVGDARDDREHNARFNGGQR